jgi:hypothetical protein
MRSMDHLEEKFGSLSQHATTYVDQLIRMAPPCGRPLTAAMREDTIAMVEWAMHELVRSGERTLRTCHQSR